MAKANKKVTNIGKSKLMNEKFDQLISILDDMATSSEEIMPLLSETLRLAVKIAKTYKKAFNAGTKYTK